MMRAKVDKMVYDHINWYCYVMVYMQYRDFIMQQKLCLLGQHENHKFANQLSSADCQQAKVVICHS